MPEKTFTVNFRNVPWKDAIAWYAEITGLTLIGDHFPTGTVTLQPPKDRKFTIGEITDLLNEAMTQQKFIIIRRRRRSSFTRPTRRLTQHSSRGSRSMTSRTAGGPNLSRLKLF